MRNVAISIATVVMLTASALLASAQVVTASKEGSRATVPCQFKDEEAAQRDGRVRTGLCVLSNPATPLQAEPTTAAQLTKLHRRGTSKDLYAFAWLLLSSLKQHVTAPELDNLDRDYYRVVWTGPDADDKPTVYTLLIHGHEVPEAGVRLPGVTTSGRVRLHDLVVSERASIRLETLYSSTRTDDPEVAKIPSFVEKSGVLGFLAGVPGIVLPAAAPPAKQPGPPPPPPPPAKPRTGMTVAFYEPNLPMARADIAIRDYVTTGPPIDGFLSDVRNLSRDLPLREARGSACAKSLSVSHAVELQKVATGAACSGSPLDGDACLDAFDTALKTSFTMTIATQACKDEPVLPTCGDPVLFVDGAFHQALGNLGKNAQSGESKLANVPRSKYSFGLLTGVIVGDPFGGDVRAKISDDTRLYVEDPAGAALTMAIVNIQPWGYDPSTHRPSVGERLRLFLGTTLTPDFGVGGGIGVGILRGLSVNVGVAQLFVNSPKGGASKLGSAPEDQRDPFKVGRLGVWFSGLSFSF